MNLKPVAVLLLLAILVYLGLSMLPQHTRVITAAHTNVSPFAQRGVETVGDVRGGPTLSAAFMDQVLAAAQSPAQGGGNALYQLSQQYQVDDAYALAFFHHESTYGKYGIAATTHNFGNIRCTAGYACDPSGGYRAYRSWAEGAADWYQLIATVYLSQGRVTVAAIIPMYAPAADHNDEVAYIQSVLADVARYRVGEVQG